MKTLIKALAISATATLVILSARAASPNPFIGTWSLDLKKSTFQPTPWPIKSQTLAITAASAGKTSIVLDTAGNDGSTFHVQYTTSNDGKPVPVTGDPDDDSVKVTSINGTTSRTVWMKDGKVTGDGTLTVSADGKTLTGPFSGTNPDGTTSKARLVYVKQ